MSKSTTQNYTRVHSDYALYYNTLLRKELMPTDPNWFISFILIITQIWSRWYCDAVCWALRTINFGISYDLGHLFILVYKLQPSKSFPFYSSYDTILTAPLLHGNTVQFYLMKMTIKMKKIVERFMITKLTINLHETGYFLFM